jgi:D-sedoheptulose 7-phosphate isomerase
VNALERIFQQHPSPERFAREYVRHLTSVLASIDAAAVASFAGVLLEARSRGAAVFFIGNGGSAATASHFANDLAIGTCAWEKPFRVSSLTDNVPVLTALANDLGYEEVFVRQLQVMLQPGDVLVAISASGNSPNVLRAVEYANAHEAVTVGLTGFDGGRLRQIVKVAVHVPTGHGEYGPVEDAHMVLDHLLGAFLKLACRAEDPGASTEAARR